MAPMIQRSAAALLLLALVLIAVSESSANPGQEQHDVNSVADAIRYLQDLESRHQFARPRSRSQTDEISINAHHDSVKALLGAILEQIDQSHSRTPRFGKRGGNDFMTKEYTNNYLRYLLENPPEATN